MRLQEITDLCDHRPETEQFQGQVTLGLFPHGNRSVRLRRGHPTLAEDRPDPRLRVLQVRAGVAGQGQHPVEVERVLGVVGHRQVRVLDRTDTDLAGDLGPLLLVQVGTVLRHDHRGTLHGFVQQGHEPNRGTAAGAQDLAVAAEDVADLDVRGLDVLRQPPRLACGRPHHLEVHGLRRTHHVQHAVGLEGIHAVPDRGQVGGGVAVAAVALADDERERFVLTAGETVQEHAQGVVADLGDALGRQLVAHVAEHVVVGALPGQVLVGEGDTELGVDLVEVHLGQSDDLAPQAQGLLVTALQRDHATSCTGGEVVLVGAGGVEFVARRLVEGVRVGGEQVGLGGVLTDLQQVLDEHAEGGTPVTDVVLADDVVAQEFQGPGQGVADHRGA